MIRRLFALGLAFALTVIALGSAQSTFAGDGGGTPYPTPPDGFIGDTGTYNPDGSKSIPVRGPLSAADQQIVADKDQLIAQHDLVHQGDVDPQLYQQAYVTFLESIGERDAAMRVTNRGVANRGVTTMAAHSSYSLPLSQTPQEKYYYCGPGSAYSILAELGYWTSHDNEALSQSRLATDKYLETEKWTGTPWYVSSTDQPYPQTLNYWRTGSYSGFYIASGSNFSASTFKGAMTTDIDSGWPVAGNGWEVAGNGNPHFVGHPTNQEIFHWVAIYGYTASGDYTSYADPVHNAPSVSWYQGVPAYSTITTNTMTTILNGRGYVY